MSDAFKCDFCGEFHSGRPEQTLYAEEHQKGGSSSHYVEQYHMCEGCNEAVERGDGVA